MTKFKLYEGRPVTAVSINGSWVTISAKEGSESYTKKIRTGAFNALPDYEAKSGSGVTEYLAASRVKLLNSAKCRITTTAEGNRSMNCGDEVAAAMEGLSLLEIYSMVAKRTGVPKSELLARYERLNPGMQRMNLGNRLRGVIAREAKGAEENAQAETAEVAEKSAIPLRSRRSRRNAEEGKPSNA